MTATPKRGRGRPRLGPPMRSTGLYLPVELSDRLRAADPKGANNLAAGLRALVEERDALAAALTRACADLLAVDRAEGDTSTAAELAASYAEIARTEAADRAPQPVSAGPARDAWTDAQPGRWLVDALKADAAGRQRTGTPE